MLSTTRAAVPLRIVVSDDVGAGAGAGAEAGAAAVGAAVGTGAAGAGEGAAGAGAAADAAAGADVGTGVPPGVPPGPSKNSHHAGSTLLRSARNCWRISSTNHSLGPKAAGPDCDCVDTPLLWSAGRSLSVTLDPRTRPQNPADA